MNRAALLLIPFLAGCGASGDAGKPTISSLDPNHASEVGGTAFTLYGSGFNKDAVVRIGNTMAQSQWINSSQINCVSPPHPVGTFDVSLTNPNLWSPNNPNNFAELKNGFTMTLAVPEVQAVTPAEGPAVRGAVVTVNGKDFLPGASVSVGEAAAKHVMYIDSKQLAAFVPSGPPGPADVKVTNPNGTSDTLEGGFRFVVGPGQRLRKIFDQLDLSINDGNGFKDYTNEQGSLAWGESYFMMAYAAMFEATKDPWYLKKLADHADAVLANRDDLKGVTDYHGVAAAGWRNFQSGSPVRYVVHTGMITYPMARFCAFVHQDPALANLPTFDGATFGQKRALYLQRVDECIAAHEGEWSVGPQWSQGYYFYPHDAPGGIPKGMNVPANQQNAMGRTLVAMYEATGSGVYYGKAAKLANLFREFATLEDDKAGWAWDYWNHIGDIRFDGPGEDIGHAAINVDFAAAACRAGIVFTDADLSGFAATFLHQVIAGEASVYNLIDRSGGIGAYSVSAAGWLGLTPWDYQRKIYYTVQGIYQSILSAQNLQDGLPLLGIANLARWEGALELRGLHAEPDPAWAGIAGADLDGDGKAEVAAIRDGGLFAYQFNPQTQSFTNWGSNLSLGAEWAGLAAGNLDGDGADEIVAVRNGDGQIYFFDGLTLVGQTSDWDPASSWAGIGIGVFAPGENPWVVLARNSDGKVFLMDYQLNGSGQTIASFESPSGIGSLVVGDFDGNGLAEIALTRNSDGKILIFQWNGQSIQLVASTDGIVPSVLAAADLDGDGAKEIVMAPRNAEGGVHRWRRVDGQLRSLGVHVPVGASHSWAGLAGARFVPGENADRLAGLSNRTGDLLLYQLGNP